MLSNKIPFNKPYMTGKELYYIAQAHFDGRLAGDGPYTARCHDWLTKATNCKKALLTHSCTAALEMAALLIGTKPGDEIIMPSYTFVSTANAFVLRGGVPVFVDIRPDTLNMDEQLLGDAITAKTKAIVPIHYAGVSCEMDEIVTIANRYNIKVIEDAAQGLMSKYKGRPLGSIGDFGTYSFHETKNIISGEGGALAINSKQYFSQAEIIREKGTDRSRFYRGEVDKYTWQEIGSSYLPGELIAAFLWAQMEDAFTIISERKNIWEKYHEALKTFEKEGLLVRPNIPHECDHNGHMYYILLNEGIDRKKILSNFQDNRILAVFHYVPLHSSPAGKKYCRTAGQLSVTNNVSERIIRLPLWVGLTDEEQSRIIDVLIDSIKNK